jgi:collagenase-like PrtC family protease
MQAFNRQIISLRDMVKNKNTKVIAEKERKLGIDGCGICRIPFLKKLGINHFKIVGRELKIDTLINDVKAVKQIIEVIKKDDNVNDKYIQRTFFDKCPVHSCYYPN